MLSVLESGTAWCCSGAELSENAGDLLILAWQVWWDVAMCVFLLLAPEHKGSSRWNHSINIFALLIYFLNNVQNQRRKNSVGASSLCICVNLREILPQQSG